MFVYLDGPITLMAPTDDAFNRLGNDTVAKLLQNPKLLGGKFTPRMPLPIADNLPLFFFVFFLSSSNRIKPLFEI